MARVSAFQAECCEFESRRPLFFIKIIHFKMNMWKIDRIVEEKWFGFIIMDNGGKVFFHASVLWEGEDGYQLFQNLQLGDEVEFDFVKQEDWRLKATSMRII